MPPESHKLAVSENGGVSVYSIPEEYSPEQSDCVDIIAP